MTEILPLSRVLDQALEKLRPQNSSDEPRDGILFSGNRHESVPRALFIDPRLTPLERNAWQVFRMLLNDGGVTAFPTYKQLGSYLTSMPCSGRASDETVARALTLLRLTRWLTLARHRRDPTTGRIQGNLYVLHDEPLVPYEAIQLDPRYLGLVSQALTHASKAIQHVGYYTLKEITEDPLLLGRVLPSRLQLFAQRLASQGWAHAAFPRAKEDSVSEDHEHSHAGVDDSEATADSRPNNATPASDSEAGTKTANDNALRIPKQDSTVRTDSMNNKVRTVLRAHEHSRLQLPERFARLRPEQQTGALAALQQVEITLQQPVLDEWAARCHASTVRNPAGYLFGIIQKAMRGDFHAWASQRKAGESERVATTTAPERAPLDTPARREIAQQHIAKLRAMLQIP